MRPVAMPPNVIDHDYLGGERLAAFRGVLLPSPRRPEEWLGEARERLVANAPSTPTRPRPGRVRVTTVGVEGTGSYGAGLARHLQAAGVVVVEIDRPDRRIRRARGKSNPIDAYAAARTALSGAHVVVPKARDGIVEAIRVLRVTRRGPVKARTQTTQVSRLRGGSWPAQGVVIV